MTVKRKTVIVVAMWYVVGDCVVVTRGPKNEGNGGRSDKMENCPLAVITGNNHLERTCFVGDLN